MEVTLNDLVLILKELLGNKTTREIASEKVFKYYNFDNRILFNLEFKPEKDEKYIWETVEFIYAVDMKNSPVEYFYSIQDIEEFYERRIKYIKQINI